MQFSWLGIKIYISGGARLYEEALPLVEKMYITEIDCDIKGDTYFPSFESEQFVKEINERFESEIPYTYVTYTRKRENIEWISKWNTLFHTPHHNSLLYHQQALFKRIPHKIIRLNRVLGNLLPAIKRRAGI